MNTFFTNALRQIREFIAKLSRRDRIRLSVLAALIIVFSVALASMLGRVDYATLYNNLSAAENGQIIAALDEMAVPYRTQGNAILVPAEQVAELRMRLEAEGLQGGDLPTDIIDRALGFGVNAEDRATYNLLQQQSYLRNVINRMEKIEDSYVLLNVPKTSAFAKAENTPASATVMLETKNGASLTPAEAYAIGSAVMGYVGGLAAENIKIVDSNLNIYPMNSEGNAGGTNAIDYQYALRDQVKQDIETQVTNFLIPVFGEGHVRALASVTLDFDKTQISSVDFEPPVEDETEGIIVSMQELYESNRYATDAIGEPGTTTNGLGTPEYPYIPLQDDELYYKVLREMNYELDETRTQIERAQGTIQNLSIAIMLDSNTIEEDYSTNVINLVAQAIGVNSRYISVERLPFQLADTEVSETLRWQEEFMRTIQNRDLIKTGIIALAVVLLAFMVFSFIRTVLRTFAPPQPTVAMAGAPGIGGAVDYLAMEDGAFIPGATEKELEDIPVNTKSEAMDQLEKFIDRDPASVAQMLRNWLSDDLR